MENTLNKIEKLVGNTPFYNLEDKIFAKLESYNIAGSIKDRVALQMIKDLYHLGKIKSSSVIIEPTSGNTGIGLAAICAAINIKLITVIPKDMSKERVNIIKAYGAKVMYGKNMLECIDICNNLHKDIPNSIIADQFNNPSNWRAHYLTTGPEILKQSNGYVDYFVCTVGTGGTITGVGKYLKEKLPGIKIIAVEPKNSAVLSGKPAGKHKIQGIGAGFIPKILDTSIYDKVFKVSDDAAYDTCRMLAKKFGIFVGISSGAAYFALKCLPKNKKIVTIFPDSGDRYLSLDLWNV